MLRLLKMLRFLKERMKAWEAQDYDWREGVEFFAGRRWQLGELQSVFAAFITSLTEYARFMELDYYARKLRFQEKHWVDNAPIFGWQSGSMS